MTIAKGDSLPEATFRIMEPEGIKTLTTKDIFAGKKVVMFAVPGAFTPTCHLKHLPGYIENADHFKKEGIDTIACVAVNDPFVMAAWADASGSKGKVLFLSDGNAEFTKKIGTYTSCKHYERDSMLDVTLLCTGGTVSSIAVVWLRFAPIPASKPLPPDGCE